MTLEEIIKLKLDRMEDVPDAYVKAVGQTQKEIFSNILDSLELLVRDANGNIKKTQKNLAIIENIIEDLQKVFSRSDYAKITREFVSEFDVQVEVTDDFFKKAFDNFEDSSFSKKALEISKKNAYNLMAGTPTITKNLYEPVRELLTNAVVTGDSYTKTVKAIRQNIQGGTINDKVLEGKLAKYAKQMAYDTFAVVDRNYTQQIAEDLEVEWYNYVGGRIEDTRPFCVARNGKYFHKTEIINMGNLIGLYNEPIESWQGRIPSTDAKTIFTYAGGYNCRHFILPTSEFAVPKADIIRNIEKGYYKPDEKTLELLEI